MPIGFPDDAHGTNIGSKGDRQRGGQGSARPTAGAAPIRRGGQGLTRPTAGAATFRPVRPANYSLFIRSLPPFGRRHPVFGVEGDSQCGLGFPAAEIRQCGNLLEGIAQERFDAFQAHIADFVMD